MKYVLLGLGVALLIGGVVYVLTDNEPAPEAPKEPANGKATDGPRRNAKPVDAPAEPAPAEPAAE